jgi:predicted nucleotidyltransferase component of viral defense system
MTFLIERMLVRLMADSKLSDALVFKGGYVGLRIYHSPRNTVDLDAVIQKGSLTKLAEVARMAVEKDIGDGTWFRFDETVDLETQGEYGGIRIVFRGGTGEVLKDLKRARVVNLDIGHGDPITPGPVDVETPAILGHESISWRVYPIETTAAEKLHALVARGSESSRSKDIFDLWFLLPKCNKKELKKALQVTFEHRGDALPPDLARYLSGLQCDLLQRGWRSAIAGVNGAPVFDEAFRAVIEGIRKI